MRKRGQYLFWLRPIINDQASESPEEVKRLKTIPDLLHPTAPLEF
jgi:hypothetical protein